ncbi:MAG: MFS transporter [Erysipelotrichaceae bacterium]|nr:MFS transporter [Erysipelotrichaceae bacterium]
MQKKTIFSLPFIMVLLVSVISGSASYMVNPILPAFLISRGAPMEITGIISSLMSLVALFGRPFSGAASDRFNKKNLMILSYILSILCLFLYSKADTVPMIIFVRILNGIAFSLSGTVSMAFGADFLPLERLGEGMSYIGIGTVISTMIGPQLGDFIDAKLGMEQIFIWAGVLNLVCGIITYFIPYRSRNEGKKEKFVFRMENFFAPELFMYVFLIGVLSIGNGILLYYLKDFGTSRGIVNISLYYTVSSITTVLTKPFTGRWLDRKGVAYTLYPAFVISAVFAVCFARAYALPLVLIAGILKAIGQGSGQSAIQADSVRMLGLERSGVASSSCYIGMDLGNVLGPAIGAFVISDFGYGPLFYAYAVVLLLCIPIYYLYTRKTKEKVSQS